MASRGGRAGSLAPSESDGGGVSAGEQEGPPAPPLSRVAQLQGRRNQLCYPIDTLTLVIPALCFFLAFQSAKLVFYRQYLH